MSKLQKYYQDHQYALKALDRYSKLVDKWNWNIDGEKGKLYLYNLASRAFDPNTPQPKAIESFSDMYETIRGWPGMQRRGRLAPAEKVFDVLLQNGNKFLVNRGIDLSNLTIPSSEASDLSTFLPELSFVKPTKQYPWMPVSKVLHFANPALFPMWDNKVIWGKVMGNGSAFKNEYRLFCKECRFTYSEYRPIFLLYYVLWAASYIQQSSTEFMGWFVDWMNRNFAEDIAHYGLSQSLATYYAVAFEFVVIGAAFLELGE